MGKSYKRVIPQHFDDEKTEKNIKSRHFKHQTHINMKHEVDVDIEEVDDNYKLDMEYFMSRWK